MGNPLRKSEVNMMTTIHQAVFGYSNGHHLISSSVSFNSKTLNTLETLSDLAGTTISENFDGYLTGFPITEENIYVISKTWFASEMPRPGCVWTHALFIPLEISDEQLRLIDFETIFHRPNTSAVGWESLYSKPIQINNFSNKSFISNKTILKYYYDLLSIIIENNKPVIITASDCTNYNYMFEEIIKNIGISFIKDISFSTGSFLLRMLGNFPFLFQVVPLNLSKSRLKSKFDIKIISENADKSFNYKTLYNKEDIISAFSFLSESCNLKIDKIKIKYILELYSSLKCNKYISIKEIIQNGIIIFDCNYPINAIIRLVFEQKLTTDQFDNQMLFEFCTLDAEFESLKASISIEMLNSSINCLFEKGNLTVFSLFKQLIDSNLNEFGEILIKSIASRADNDLMNYFINDNDSIPLKTILSLNYKLTLNDSIWRLSLDTQCDVIKIISENYFHEKSKDEVFGEKIITLIYSTSQYDLSSRLYYVFNKMAIKVFFKLINSKKDKTNIMHWCNICKYNSFYSIMCIKESDLNEATFIQIINVLDPYDDNLLNISTNVWMSFYKQFCQGNNNTSTNNVYAQFILPIILRSKVNFPTELIDFAFSTVHYILYHNEMEYQKWEKLSVLLPEIQLHNMWDKCKRLRKASKEKNITIDLKKCK